MGTHLAPAAYCASHMSPMSSGRINPSSVPLQHHQEKKGKERRRGYGGVTGRGKGEGKKGQGEIFLVVCLFCAVVVSRGSMRVKSILLIDVFKGVQMDGRRSG